MPIYWLNIDVQFKEPMEVQDEESGETSDQKAYGYMQDIGATYPDEESLKSAVASLVYESTDAAKVEIVYEYVGEIAPNEVQKEIYQDKDVAQSLRSDPAVDGIWYRTGRGFYMDEK